MTTVVKDIGKCTVCNKHKHPAEFENPLAKRFGICDQCFMHRQMDWENRNPDAERENLKEKAVMAVSSPEEGKTCNCNHGDHSNANGDLHSMYNQEGGRANWQGQGLPQPKHSNCQCDEQPVEHDKVPNADARLGEPKKDKKKTIYPKECPECEGKGTKTAWELPPILTMSDKPCTNCGGTGVKPRGKKWEHLKPKKNKSNDDYNPNREVVGAKDEDDFKRRQQGLGGKGGCRGVGCDKKAKHKIIALVRDHLTGSEVTNPNLSTRSHKEIINLCPDCYKKAKEWQKKRKNKHHGLVGQKGGRIDKPKEIFISDLEEGGDGIFRPEKNKLRAGQIRARGRKKGKTSPSERNRFSRRLATTSGRGKDKLKKPKKSKEETKKLLANPSDAVRLNYERNIAAGLAGEKERKKRPHQAAETMYKRIFGGKKGDKKRTDITQSILTIKSGLEDILKKRKVRRGGKGSTRKRSGAHHTGRWRGGLKQLQDRSGGITTDNTETAANRAAAATLGFIKPSGEVKAKPAKTFGGWANPKFEKKKPKSKKGNKRTVASQTKEQATDAALNTKEQKEGRTGKRETKSFSFKSILEDIIKKKKGKTTGQKEKEKLEANLSNDVIANMKRVHDLQNNIDVMGRDSRTQSPVAEIHTGSAQRKKLQRELNTGIVPETSKKKRKVKPKKRSKFQILDFVRHCNHIIAKVTGEAEANPEMSAQEWLDNYKKNKKRKQLRYQTASHGKKFDWEGFFRKHGLRSPEKKKKVRIIKGDGMLNYFGHIEEGVTHGKKKKKKKFDIDTKSPRQRLAGKDPEWGVDLAENVPDRRSFADILAAKKKKPKTKKQLKDEADAKRAKEESAFYIAGGAREADIARRDVTQAENNQFGGAWQRGLGDGSGTGAIQGSGETHLITPVKEKKLNELMRGIRYMPRSVSRKKKP